jgi:nitroreductase
MPDFPQVPLHLAHVSSEEMITRSADFYEQMNRRRTVRQISDVPVPRQVIEHLLLTASTAPSGAHKQPWTFCAVSSPALKKQIRAGAEEEEYENYHGRMPQEWLDDLKPFGTDWHKPFLEDAPWLIVVFKRAYEKVDGQKRNNYYVTESVGLATGLLLCAIHNAGLVALTHTPSPMNFLTKILDRPSNERPFLLIPVGYPVPGVQVPDLVRKSLAQVAVFYE